MKKPPLSPARSRPDPTPRRLSAVVLSSVVLSSVVLSSMVLSSMVLSSMVLSSMVLSATGVGVSLAAEPTPAAADQAESGDLATIMVDLGARMGDIQAGLWRGDLATVRDAAIAIADHPRVSPEERSRVQGALGVDFGAFALADRAVHDQAVSLSEAAAAEDLDATVRALSSLQEGCVACHSRFRDRLRR